MKTPRHPLSAPPVLFALLCLFLGPALAQAKRDLEGQVFIVTKGSENVRLGLVPIWVLGDAEMKALAKQAMELANAAAQKQKVEQAVKDLRELEAKAEKEFSSAGAQKVKAASSEEMQALLKSVESVSALAERGAKLLEKIDQQKRGIDSGEIFSRVMLGSELAVKMLIGMLSEKESDVESDADGKFKLSHDNSSGWVVAYSQRTVGRVGQSDLQNLEQYYWVVELPQKKAQLFLSSHNCDLSEAEVRLRALAAERERGGIFGGIKSSTRANSTPAADPDSVRKIFEREKKEQERMASEERAGLRREAVAAGKVLLDREGRALLLVPGGQFEMGSRDESRNPVHSVKVNTFFMGETEVTHKEWKTVLEWSKARGYDLKNEGVEFSDRHPVTAISWYDSVKWCNAKSEMEGFAPCYKVDGNVYRKGKESSVACDWNADGYRLPTEAEWEKAARGGLMGKKFPNGDMLEKKDANFDGSRPLEVGSYPANGYGLYDMAGNVWEWCWDWYKDISDSSVDDPKGPQTGVIRVDRGGSWSGDAADCRAADRNHLDPDYLGISLGFRLARVPSR
jgi:sulfatase modifying factor 1